MILETLPHVNIQWRVYRLDKNGQDKAREFAGQKVKVTGRITGRTIRVTAIEAAT